MNKSLTLLSACALCLLAISGLWLTLDKKPDPQQASPAAGNTIPPNRAHEKAMLEEQLLKKPGHAPVLLRLAQLSTEDGRPAEARRLLEELLKAEPLHAEARLELGRACYELNDLTCATSETEKILASDPNNPDALYNLGAISANTGQDEQARQYWMRAAEAAPSSESGKKASTALAVLAGQHGKTR